MSGMTLRYSRVERLQDGFAVDPRPYLDALPSFGSLLPEGARRFVTDADHYDFFSERSIKDLKIDRLELSDGFAVVGINLLLSYNELPDVPRLTIGYEEVLSLSVDVRPGFQVRSNWVVQGIKRLGGILTDEVLPDSRGCVHVIEMVHGTISITCRDLDAVWS